CVFFFFYRPEWQLCNVRFCGLRFLFVGRFSSFQGTRSALPLPLKRLFFFFWEGERGALFFWDCSFKKKKSGFSTKKKNMLIYSLGVGCLSLSFPVFQGKGGWVSAVAFRKKFLLVFFFFFSHYFFSGWLFFVSPKKEKK